MLAHFSPALPPRSALVPPGVLSLGKDEAVNTAPAHRGVLVPWNTQPMETNMKVRIDPGRCQGHGRCYDLAPELFGADDEGYGTVLGDGVVAPGQEQDARLAAANCPERAIELAEVR
jgi:ferredoxin